MTITDLSRPPAWCALQHEHQSGDCSSVTYSVPGVNVGTELAVWISDDDMGRGLPVPAYLGLSKDGGAPATSVYLGVAGLRELAAVATRLADRLEADPLHSR